MWGRKSSVWKANFGKPKTTKFVDFTVKLEDGPKMDSFVDGFPVPLEHA